MSNLLDRSPASDRTVNNRHPRIQGAACDQCRSKKIRCNRLQPVCRQCTRRKSQCSWENVGRKTNQVTDSLHGFDHRLEGIETSLQSILHLLKTPPRPTSLDTQHQSNQRGTASVSNYSSPYTGNSTNADTHESFRPGRLGQGRSYGGTSLQSLLSDADAQLESKLAELCQDVLELAGTTWGQFLAQRATAHDELSNALSGDAEPWLDVSRDSLPLVLPPRRALEAVIEPYFRHIDAEIPLLDRQRCIEAINQCYGGEAERVDPAWKVIFNYIMILCFQGRYMPLERSTKDIDFFLTKEFDLPYLEDLRGACACLSLFTEPSFTNVQALVALTILAQRYFSAEAAKTYLHLMCFVAKAIGLHRQCVQDLTPAEIEERRRVFWAVFTLDKELSLVLGLAPCLPSYDCDVDFPQSASPSSLFRARFSQWMEKMYASLYSAAAAKKDQPTIERDIKQLETELQELEACDILKKSTDNTFLHCESRYIYHLGSVMILRPSKDEERNKRCVEEAYTCIEYLTQIPKSNTTIGGFMVLRRPFQWRPSMPFFVIMSSVIKDAGPARQQQGIKAMKAFVGALRSVAWTDDASSYCGTLLQATETCLELTRAFVQACETDKH